MLQNFLTLFAQTTPPGPPTPDPPNLTYQYGPLFMIVGFSAVIAIAVFALATLLGPKNPTPEKLTPYESGSPSTGARHIRLSVKFYLTALLFVVFDIEAVFLYPWATLYRELGAVGLIEMFIFLATLTIGLIYCWKKGALEWET